MTTLGIIVLVIVSMLAGFFINAVIHHAREEVKVGRPAPAFTGRLLDGTLITQADWNHTPRPMLLCFVSPRCSACRRLAPFLNQTVKDYPETEVNVLLLGIGGKTEEFKHWKEELNLDLPLAVDTEGTDKLRYAVYSLPAIFLISVGGTVEMTRTGFHHGDEQFYIQLLREYQPVPVPIFS